MLKSYGRLSVADGEACMAKEAAKQVAELILRNNRAGKPTVLGLATGSTPEPLYAELVRMHQQDGLDFSNIITFNLDEYYPIDPTHPISYHRYMNEKLFSHININPDNTHIPDGRAASDDEIKARCDAYEQAIRDAGGIDLQILGIGKNGHIGFNEPVDTAATHWTQLHTRKVPLAQSTLEANALLGTPVRHAITMGTATILEAKNILLLAKGASKAQTIAECFGGDINTKIPAGILAADPRCRVILDEVAAAGLSEAQREKTFAGVTLGM